MVSLEKSCSINRSGWGISGKGWPNCSASLLETRAERILEDLLILARESILSTALALPKASKRRPEATILTAETAVLCSIASPSLLTALLRMANNSSSLKSSNLKASSKLNLRFKPSLPQFLNKALISASYPAKITAISLPADPSIFSTIVSMAAPPYMLLRRFGSNT
eukprot:Lithocolla_globosa_v1_NODE_2326_length_2046_cov_17.794576.p2 type:complete len:168 gc:universal NODE_2326_length_2046_cov_17.794576:1235-732(-)